MKVVPIEPQARENLIRLANAYCQATGLVLTTVGRYAHSDPPFFVNLITRHERWIQDGRPERVENDRKGSVTFRVYDKTVAWFIGNWPEGAAFPPLNDLTHSKQQRPQHGEKRKRRGSKKAAKAPNEKERQGPERAGGGQAAVGSASATLARLRHHGEVQEAESGSGQKANQAN